MLPTGSANKSQSRIAFLAFALLGVIGISIFPGRASA
jgi:hypothetical protein